MKNINKNKEILLKITTRKKFIVDTIKKEIDRQLEHKVNDVVKNMRLSDLLELVKMIDGKQNSDSKRKQK